jgi:hypothetical protein
MEGKKTTKSTTKAVAFGLPVVAEPFVVPFVVFFLSIQALEISDDFAFVVFRRAL